MIRTARRLGFFFRLPMLLVTLHVLLMLVAGLVWIREVRKIGALAGPEANFWLEVVQVESFPMSCVARYALEAGLPRVLRTYGSFGLSLTVLIDGGHWALLLVFGALQCYLIGVLLLRVRRRLPHRLWIDVVAFAILYVVAFYLLEAFPLRAFCGA